MDVVGALVAGGTLVVISIGSDDEVAVVLVVESRLKLNFLLLV